jgi:uncharacterized protein (DUF1330 family)
MPKGYWIVQGDVSDPEGYKEYQAANAAAFNKYGARFLARGGRLELVEGQAPARSVIIEFKDFDTAVACFRSPEYQAAREKRLGRAVINIVVTEGYEGPQPNG